MLDAIGDRNCGEPHRFACTRKDHVLPAVPLPFSILARRVFIVHGVVDLFIQLVIRDQPATVPLPVRRHAPEPWLL